MEEQINNTNLSFDKSDVQAKEQNPETENVKDSPVLSPYKT